jgi:signal transduction histidine kinase
LFGTCLLLLIFASFWWYGTATVKLVHQQKRSTGQQLVQAIMHKYHWEHWETNEDLAGLARTTIGALEDLQYKWQFLALDAPESEVDTFSPADNDEKRVVLELLTEYRQQLSNEQGRLEAAATERAAAPTEEATASEDYQPGDELFKRIVPIYRHLTRDSEYHYYQPVYWNSGCIRCHDNVQGGLAAGLSDSDEIRDLSVEREEPTAPKLLFDDVPFRVVKVMMRDTTQRAINQNRAFLLATAIITAFLAMLALYAVVRYVIIKPLKHLREVSDEIASGNYSLRADLQTNDEFEHLAESFNRMLRHLVDSQEQLRHINDELDTRVDELAQLNMHLYETNRLKGDFLANMSHELRTPLNSIIGFSDVLRDFDSLTEQQQRYVTNIGQSGRVLLDMINDVLDLAKVESGKMEVHPTEFSVASVVGAQCDVMRSMSNEKNIDLELRCPTDLPEMYTDQSKIQQILTNLLSNAIKFTPEGGRITVTIGRSSAPDDGRGRSPQLRLSVADTGVGISEEEREVIFQKFRQAKATVGDDHLTREFSGTGLGLSIVRELCKLLGGEVGVESQLGQGSTFTVLIPWSIPPHILDAARRLATVGKDAPPETDEVTRVDDTAVSNSLAPAALDDGDESTSMTTVSTSTGERAS